MHGVQEILHGVAPGGVPFGVAEEGGDALVHERAGEGQRRRLGMVVVADVRENGPGHLFDRRTGNEPLALKVAPGQARHGDHGALAVDLDAVVGARQLRTEVLAEGESGPSVGAAILEHAQLSIRFAEEHPVHPETADPMDAALGYVVRRADRIPLVPQARSHDLVGAELLLDHRSHRSAFLSGFGQSVNLGSE